MKFTLKSQMLLALFVGLLIAMNTLGIKIVEFFGASVSVGIFLMPLTFLITDIVAEVYGRKVAQQFLIAGLSTLAVFFAFAWIFVGLEPHERFTIDDSYVAVFQSSLRIMAASMVAFLLSQTHDIWVFEFWRKKTRGKHLWLRNNASTIVSQAIDTLLFMFIAFYGISPQFTAAFVLQLAWSYYLFKIIFALMDTPLVYAGARWLK